MLWSTHIIVFFQGRAGVGAHEWCRDWYVNIRFNVSLQDYVNVGSKCYVITATDVLSSLGQCLMLNKKMKEHCNTVKK